CGVVSGASAAAIAVVLFSGLGYEMAFWLTLSLTALVSSVTVGGKALGKRVGIEKSREITLFVAKTLCIFTKKQRKKK
ncbi:MAG: Mg2+ and Co2+ transporter CorB, partial [Clostridia bacterium]|nr:Mg2+ and Co2+ transporter CorB [Clostridia bacterium]